MKQSLIFVATTPFAVNAFLRTHLLAFSEIHEVTLCVNTAAYPLDKEIALVVRVRHVDIARKIAPSQDLVALFQLLRLFRAIRPTAVHSMTPKAGLLAMLAARLVGVPLRLHTFTGQIWATRNGVVRHFLKSLDRLIALLASNVFADSESQCRLLFEEGVVRDGQIRILGSGSIAGVDIRRFRPNPPNRARLREQLGTEPGTCVFLFVGRLAEDKGVFDLIYAFRELATTMSNVELWVVGPDEDGLLHTLQECATGCDAIIRWLGPTSSPEYFMASADVLLLPSYREGFGSVIIEGAACGIPSIAYRIDGVTDAVVDEYTGLLVELGQISAFASAMERLASHADLRLRLAHQARERATCHFTSVNVTKAWLDFYHSHFNPIHEANR